MPGEFPSRVASDAGRAQRSPGMVRRYKGKVAVAPGHARRIRPYGSGSGIEPGTNTPSFT